MPYQPLVNPTSLANLNQVPLDMTLEGMDWFNRARSADEQNFQDLPSAIKHAQSMRPLDFQRKQLENEISLAQLPGMRAHSAMQGRKNKMEEITFDDEVSAKLSKLATQMKEDDIKKIEFEGQKLLTSANPDERWRGAQLLAASKKMFEDSQKQYRDIEMEGIKHRNAMERDRANQESRERVAGLKAEFDKAKALAKTPKDYQELGVRLSMQLQQTSDPTQRTMLEAQIEYANAMADRLRYQATPAPVVDPRIAPGVLQDPTKPMPAPPGATPAAGGRVRVIGPDGRVGTIPSEQLSEALKSGYKEAK